MAIINIERLNRLKKEKEVELEAIENQYNSWLRSMSNRLDNIKEILNDLNDTYRFFQQNKLNLDIFNVEGYDIGFKKWSEYSGYKDYIECGLSKSQAARYYIHSGIFLIRNGIAGYADYSSKTYKDCDTFKNVVECSLSKLETYCAIMNERLNNI